MTYTTKRCIDCKHHFEPWDGDLPPTVHVCRWDQWRDIVDGAFVECREARMNGSMCGLVGVKFEPKED